MLKLMYITKIPEVAKIAEDVGVDRIMVDMEYMMEKQDQDISNWDKIVHKVFNKRRTIWTNY